MTTNKTRQTVTLFHRTTERNAANIVRVGFLDGADRYMTAAEYSGVWLTNDPDRVEGAKGDTLLVVHLDIGFEELDVFEWRNERGTYREWLVPADFLKAHVTSLLIDEKEPDLDGIPGQAGADS